MSREKTRRPWTCPHPPRSPLLQRRSCPLEIPDGDSGTDGTRPLTLVPPLGTQRPLLGLHTGPGVPPPRPPPAGGPFPLAWHFLHCVCPAHLRGLHLPPACSRDASGSVPGVTPLSTSLNFSCLSKPRPVCLGFRIHLRPCEEA